MDRRDFLKGLGALASMPFVGKFLRPFDTPAVREGVVAATDKGIEFYNMVIQKVMKEGKKVGERDRVEIYTHPDKPEVKVEFDRSNGSANVEFMTDRETRAMAEIRVDKGPETGGRTVEELQESEVVFRSAGDEYVDDVEEGIESGITNLEDFVGRPKKKDGGIMELTMIKIPDIEVSGVETLFKSR